MSRKRASSDVQARSGLPLLELVERASSETKAGLTRGVLDLDTAVRVALVESLRNSPLSRAEVADEVSRAVDRSVSEATLNAWCSESKDGHRLPAAYVPALCRITGSTLLLRVIAEASAVHVVDGQTLLLAERARRERRIAADRKALRALDAALPEEPL